MHYLGRGTLEKLKAVDYIKKQKCVCQNFKFNPNKKCSTQKLLFYTRVIGATFQFIFFTVLFYNATDFIKGFFIWRRTSPLLRIEAGQAETIQGRQTAKEVARAYNRAMRLRRK